MATDPAALMRRMYDEMSQGKLELIDEMLTDDFVEHEEMPGLTATGREGVKEFFGLMRSAFPDLRFEVEGMVASGDIVVSRVRMRGTHEGTFMDLPATGNEIDVPIADWVRFHDGKAAEHWGVMDTGVLMQQLGATSAPA